MKTTVQYEKSNSRFTYVTFCRGIHELWMCVDCKNEQIYLYAISSILQKEMQILQKIPNTIKYQDRMHWLIHPFV
jgi:hypothetical protein